MYICIISKNKHNVEYNVFLLGIYKIYLWVYIKVVSPRQSKQIVVCDSTMLTHTVISFVVLSSDRLVHFS